jgi:hypothetical protein
VALLWWVVSQAPFRPSIWLILPMGFAAIGGAFTLIEWVIRRRATPNFVQLRYRLGQAPFAEYLAEIQQRLRSSLSTGCVVHFQGSGLPRGNRYWVAVDLTGSPKRAGSIKIRVGPFFWWDDVTPDLLGKFDLKSCELDQRLSDEFNDLLNADYVDMRSIPSQVRDGFPCHIAIITSEQVVESCANLAGLSQEQKKEPTVRLMRLVLSGAEKLTS